MSVRVRSRFFDRGRERTPGEQASVVAATAWKASVHGLKTLRQARFSVDTGAPYLAVLDEFLAFLVAGADRIAWIHDAGEWREAFTVALALRLGELYEESLNEAVGPGDHKQRFIDLLNARLAEYADFSWDDDGPDFGFRRYFASCVESALADAADRPWAIDQVMSVQAPEAMELVERSLRGVLTGSAQAGTPSR